MMAFVGSPKLSKLIPIDRIRLTCTAQLAYYIFFVCEHSLVSSSYEMK